MENEKNQPDKAALEARIAALTMELGAARQALLQRPSPTRFLPRIGHELRTPLNAILGFSQILCSDSLPKTPEQQRKFAEHILKAGRHLLVLVNQTVDLIKLDALPAMVAPLLLADLFDRCASMSAALAETFAIRLAFPAGVAIRIETDGERLQHALLIVIENAIKYNRAGGSVCIDCTLPEAGKVCITVSDTGPGLDNEQLAGLFQPFSRLGQEASVIAGSGIGLHLAQGLLASLGGDIRADSAVGVGSVFTLTLPIASPVTGLDCVEPG